MDLDLDVPEATGALTQRHVFNLTDELETFVEFWILLSCLSLALFQALQATHIAHVGGHVGHRQAEAVAHVLQLQLLAAEGSKVCSGEGRHATQVDSHDVSGLIGLDRGQGRKDCGLARRDSILVLLLSLLSFYYTCLKGLRCTVWHREVDRNLLAGKAL